MSESKKHHPNWRARLHLRLIALVSFIVPRQFRHDWRHEWEAELHHQRAQILLALNPSDVREAEAHLKKSMQVARGQNAKSLELRAATTLSELWRMQGNPDEARALLEPIYGWFHEGAETADLRRARDVRRALH